jgi:ligand-binding sensor domain-containing protein/DNA-binding response OmpR family regulator/two-component sensor histidine kinase
MSDAKKFSALIFLLFLTTSTFAQNARLYGSKDYGPIELSSNLINKICQDSYGFIWIATDYGLNKFDGLRFSQYFLDEDNPKSLLSNNVVTLTLDQSKRLWIGYNNGLQYFSPEENAFITISFPDGIKPHVAKIIQLKNGEIWVTTSGEGVFLINPETLKAEYLHHITQLTGKFLSHIYEDNEKRLWINVDRKGIVLIDSKRKTAKTFSQPIIPHNTVTGIVENKEGQLYISFSNAICTFDKKSEKFTVIGLFSIYGMILSKSNVIYLATQGDGVKTIDHQANEVVSLPKFTNSLNYNSASISTLIEDHRQNLWLGCFQKGLLMIPNGQTQFDYWGLVNKDYQLGNHINSIFKDSDDNLWCSINNEGLLKFNNKGDLIKKNPNIKNIVNLYESADHTLWASSYFHGLAKVDKETGNYNFVNIPNKGYMKTFTEGKDKKLYISTFGYGFISYNPANGAIQKFDMNDKDIGKGRLQNNWINKIIKDSKGLIWLGHYKGISVYNPNNQTFSKSFENSILSSQICLSLLEDQNGDIWVGTYNGLFLINRKDNSIKTFTTKNGLSSNVIAGLAVDEEGNIWCSTFKGLNQIKTDKKTIINYFVGNGLIDKIYNRGVYHKDNNGKIWFAGNTGVTSFFPSQITSTNYDFPIQTTNVYIRNQAINTTTLSGNQKITSEEVSKSKEFNFSYEDNSFTLEFSTMDFKDPESIFYEYRLKELSKSWTSTLPGNSLITYNHLNPGKYTLEVRACKFGSYSPTKTIILNIAHPWYKSTLAYLFYIGILIGIGILIIKLVYKRRDELVKEYKLELFTDISHEIRSPLTLVISPLEKLLKQNFDTATMKALQVMYRNSNRILTLINQLLDIRKADLGQMKLKYSEIDIVAYIKDYIEIFEYQSQTRKINLSFKHDIDELFIWIDRDNFDKILMNLLSNAFKFTPDHGDVTISLSVHQENEKYAQIEIVDSGIGLEVGKYQKIFERYYQGNDQQTFTKTGSGIGLNLTKILVELHHGTISASNRKDDKGSCFTLRLPLGKHHIKDSEIAKYTPDLQPIINKSDLETEIFQEEKVIKTKTNIKILVVDDEIEIRNYLKQELEQQYKIITAGNGEEGLQMAITQSPDLVISDVKMPKMDGFNFVKKLKNNSNVSHIPIILLTSKTEYEDRMAGLDHGADAYLNKPFNVKELLITINNLIKSRNILKGKFSGAQDQEDKIKPVAFKSSDEALIERIMAIINDNISNPDFNVEMLSSKIGLSRVQLHRKVKELTSLSAGEFIRNIRLKQAAILLKDKKMNISQIAYTIGFTNQTHFSTAFKKFYGISPTEYIQQH